jgi:hypothetical protein
LQSKGIVIDNKEYILLNQNIVPCSSFAVQTFLGLSCLTLWESAVPKLKMTQFQIIIFFVNSYIFVIFKNAIEPIHLNKKNKPLNPNIFNLVENLSNQAASLYSTQKKQTT